MANQKKDFARRLKLAMASANMNQKELAEKSGCSRAAISQYCTGMYTPDDERLLAIAETLGVRPAFLRGEETSTGKKSVPPLSVMFGSLLLRPAAVCGNLRIVCEG